jgi:phage terminase small subunit
MMPRTVKKDANLLPGKPLKPANLSARASKEWDRLTGELEASQIQVTAAHRAPLSMAATISADIQDAWETVQEDGAYIVNAKTGAVVAHPASKRLDALRRDYVKVLAMLGLRTAVAGKDPEKEETLEDMLKG